MKVLRREWFSVSGSDTFRIYPIGDVHIGAAACDEDRLRRLVERIAADDRAYWVGIGDYVDAINRSDPRFNPATLAGWVTVADLVDLAQAQRDRFLDIVAPIAGKCLALLEGNHESVQAKWYERDVYSEIVTGVKGAGGFPAEYPLGLGYYGWLQLAFHRSGAGERRAGTKVITLNLHHGFGGGRLAGSKALNMQRWLWAHDCDLAIFGHTHSLNVQVEAVERIDGRGNVSYHRRMGCYAGSFLKTTNHGVATYSERKGYLPLPLGGVEIVLRPQAKNSNDVLRIVTRA